MRPHGSSGRDRMTEGINVGLVGAWDWIEGLVGKLCCLHVCIQSMRVDERSSMVRPERRQRSLGVRGNPRFVDRKTGGEARGPLPIPVEGYWGG
jgi:hypothetical protein